MNSTKTLTEIETQTTDAPATTKVDQEALKALFWRKEELPELETVSVRCDHSKMVWVLRFKDGHQREEQRAVLVDVKFQCKLDRRGGCGFADDYSGQATGGLATTQAPSTMPPGAVAIKFSCSDGCFYLRGTYHEITEADYLVLDEDCQARVIFPPKKQGGK